LDPDLGGHRRSWVTRTGTASPPRAGSSVLLWRTYLVSFLRRLGKCLRLRWKFSGNPICDGRHEFLGWASPAGALSCVYAWGSRVDDTHSGHSSSSYLSQCCESIVPFLPGGAEGSGFVPASTLDVMEVRAELRKFINETPVAQRRGMLSSGRTARTRSNDRAAQGGFGARGGRRPARRPIGKSTLWSDSLRGRGSRARRRWAATYGPLRRCRRQEAKLVPVTIDRGADAGVRVAGGRTDHLTRRPISALRPESQPVRSCAHAGESMQLVEGWRSWELRWRK
jgi:hypothetical protein